MLCVSIFSYLVLFKDHFLLKQPPCRWVKNAVISKLDDFHSSHSYIVLALKSLFFIEWRAIEQWNQSYKSIWIRALENMEQYLGALKTLASEMTKIDRNTIKNCAFIFLWAKVLSFRSLTMHWITFDYRIFCWNLNVS